MLMLKIQNTITLFLLKLNSNDVFLIAQSSHFGCNKVSHILAFPSHVPRSPLFSFRSSPVLDTTRTASVFSAAAPTAGQAGDDDFEQGDDAANNGLEDGADGVDNGHEAVAYGLEDSFDLSCHALAWNI